MTNHIICRRTVSKSHCLLSHGEVVGPLSLRVCLAIGAWLLDCLCVRVVRKTVRTRVPAFACEVTRQLKHTKRCGTDPPPPLASS
jgi:hypothetical protein